MENDSKIINRDIYWRWLISVIKATTKEAAYEYFFPLKFLFLLVKNKKRNECDPLPGVGWEKFKSYSCCVGQDLDVIEDTYPYPYLALYCTAALEEAGLIQDLRTPHIAHLSKFKKKIIF